uniref:Putative secreted protein n=1 Tax=Amblyomma triste TaxID=251400 RepID=A0A023G532_AMBTT
METTAVGVALLIISTCGYAALDNAASGEMSISMKLLRYGMESTGGVDKISLPNQMLTHGEQTLSLTKGAMTGLQFLQPVEGTGVIVTERDFSVDVYLQTNNLKITYTAELSDDELTSSITATIQSTMFGFQLSESQSHQLEVSDVFVESTNPQITATEKVKKY